MKYPYTIAFHFILEIGTVLSFGILIKLQSRNQVNDTSSET